MPPHLSFIPPSPGPTPSHKSKMSEFSPSEKLSVRDLGRKLAQEGSKERESPQRPPPAPLLYSQLPLPTTRKTLAVVTELTFFPGDILQCYWAYARIQDPTSWCDTCWMIGEKYIEQVPAQYVYLIDPHDLANHAATLECYFEGGKNNPLTALSSELTARVLTLKMIPEFDPSTGLPSHYFTKSLTTICQLLYKLKVPPLWANNRLLPRLKIEWAVLNSDDEPQSFLVESKNSTFSRCICGYIGPSDLTDGVISLNLTDASSVEVDSLLCLLEFTICRFQLKPGRRRFYSKRFRAFVRIPLALPKPFNLANVHCLGPELVGKGGFSDVYKGTLNSTQIVCLKVPRMYLDPNRQSFIKEAVIWKLLQHPNVLPFLGVSYDCFSPRVCFVSPFMHNGDVNKYLQKTKMSIEDRVWLILGAANGLKYLHSLDITHGDIKGANILIDDQGRAQLSDLGIASITTQQTQTAIKSSISLAEIPTDKSGHPMISRKDKGFLNDGQITSLNTTLTNDIKGTLYWMAPEVMFPSEINSVESKLTRDIYSFGCTIFEIMTGEPPFADQPQGVVFLKVYTGERPSTPSTDILPNNLWSIVENSWKQECSQRLPSSSAEDLRRDRWDKTPDVPLHHFCENSHRRIYFRNERDLQASVAWKSYMEKKMQSRFWDPFSFELELKGSLSLGSYYDKHQREALEVMPMEFRPPRFRTPWSYLHHKRTIGRFNDSQIKKKPPSSRPDDRFDSPEKTD
ncbi:kinase-like domain-containing protein [Flagelloscypha sp. PMI_526]|nr:kinase-like domain-containing protein [Flagelloscypha sp. PMI_526]